MNCGCHGEERGRIRLLRVKDGWVAQAYVTGKSKPEFIVGNEEAEVAMEAAGLMIGGMVEENNLILEVEEFLHG